MRIKLVDVDLKYRPRSSRGKHIPNLALMNLSRHLKFFGDNEVGFNIENPDMVYISAVFSRNNANAHYEYYKYASLGIPVDMGGSGISYDKTLGDLWGWMPDYTLYPSTYSQGFTTRGCPRRCPYCIVNRKEGRFRRYLHVSQFVDLRFNTVMLMDNNILADVDWFFDNTMWIREHHLKIREHGMDIRLMTPEIAGHLKMLKFVDQQMRFAFDNLSDEEHVRAGIDMLKDAKINVKRNVSFYVMSGFNTTFAEDKYRCDLLKKLGVMAFVMKYNDNCPELNHLARWANRRTLYWSTSSDEYLKSKGYG